MEAINYKNKLEIQSNKKIEYVKDNFNKILEEIENIDSKIKETKNENEVAEYRSKLRKLKSNKKKLIKKINYEIGVIKTEFNYIDEQINYNNLNLEKLEKIYARVLLKKQTMQNKIKELQNDLKEISFDKAKNNEFKKILKMQQKIFNQNNIFNKKIDNYNSNILIINELILELEQEKHNFTEEEIILFSNEISKIDNLLDFHNTKKDKLKLKINIFQEKIEKNNYELNKVKNDMSVASDTLEKNSKLIKLNFDFLTLNSEVKNYFKQIVKRKNDIELKSIKLEILKTYIEKLSIFSTIKLELIAPQDTKITKSFDAIEKVLLKDWFFIVIVGMLSAGVVLSTYLYIEFGVGALNEIFVVEMLKQGLETGDYSAAIGFATGFLLARVLEGPLVGILDVGGSILSGVGIGIPAVFLSTSKISWMMHNPMMALLIGLIAGIIIGIIILLVRILKPKDVKGLGTDIMIGAGNATGKFLGPLVVFSAAMYNPFIGIGAGLGGAMFMWIKKPIVGGAIIGAMIFGIVPAFLI